MSTTVTVRTDPALHERIRQRAEAQGKTMSALIRDILRNALEERTAAERVGHLRGSLGAHREGDEDPWRNQIRARNWRK